MVQSVGTAGLLRGGDAEKVRECAEQFEALLISKLLENAWPESEGQDALAGHAREVIAGSLAKSGGLGLAQALDLTMRYQIHSPEVPATVSREVNG
jgi:Rod binding domain-containing protein